MKWLLLGIVIVIPLIWLTALWLLLRRGINPPTWSFSFSDVLNVALFALTIVSIGISLIGLSIAISSYQQAVDAAKKQVKAGEEQSKILQAQAEALDASRGALQEQLALAKEQRAEYLAQLAKRPNIELQIGAARHEPAFSADRTELRIKTQPGRNAFDFFIVLRNIGDAPLQKPLLVFAGRPERVTFEPKQLGSPNVQDFLPFSQVKKGYRFDVRAVFHQEIDRFQMLIDISGENMEADTTAFNVTVERQPPAPPPQQ